MAETIEITLDGDGEEWDESGDAPLVTLPVPLVPQADPVDFLTRYLAYTGKTEVPRQFHFWGAMSLIAAAVGDRVWLQREGDWKIYPNLYVFLLAVSGSGKERAVNTAAKFTRNIGIINTISGTVTKQGLLDMMGRGTLDPITGHHTPANSKIYLVTEELAAAIGSDRKLADDLVRWLTAMYIKSPVPFSDITRKHGQIIIEDACVNWLAGSTDDWLMKALGGDAIGGGFFARVIGVRGRRDYVNRCPDMIPPANRKETETYLHERVAEYTWFEGPFELSEEANTYRREWYTDRPAPHDTTMEPTFNRSDEMVCRLALILRLAELDSRTRHDGLVHRRNMEEALELWEGLVSDVPMTAKMAHTTRESAEVDIVKTFIQRAGVIQHSDLMRKCGGRGMNADTVERALKTVRAAGEIVDVVLTHGTRTKGGYEWIG